MKTLIHNAETIIVTYDIGDQVRRDEMRKYLIDLGGEMQTESVFVVPPSPAIGSQLDSVLATVHLLISPAQNDKVSIFSMIRGDASEYSKFKEHQLAAPQS